MTGQLASRDSPPEMPDSFSKIHAPAEATSEAIEKVGKEEEVLMSANRACLEARAGARIGKPQIPGVYFRTGTIWSY